MTDDLKERFRALDSLNFPHEEGPPGASPPSAAPPPAWRRIVVIATAFALTAAATGFMVVAFRPGTEGGREVAAAPVPSRAAGMARVICRRDGSTSVQTPNVLARRGGVYVRVTNLLDEELSMNGLGRDVSAGVSEWV